MEIARLTTICRKTKCGPLENELVRLRAQIAALEKRDADLESQYALMEKQLARKNARLEAEEKENADLDSKVTHLEIKILESKSELASPPPCEDCVEHELDYKKLDARNNQEIEERLQQDIRIIDLEHQVELLKDDLAYGPMEGSVWRASSAEEQAYQQAKRQHSS
jgi:hypothetical protein